MVVPFPQEVGTWEQRSGSFLSGVSRRVKPRCPFPANRGPRTEGRSPEGARLFRFPLLQNTLRDLGNWTLGPKELDDRGVDGSFGPNTSDLTRLLGP